jgi:hypothetical protein
MFTGVYSSVKVTCAMRNPLLPGLVFTAREKAVENLLVEHIPREGVTIGMTHVAQTTGTAC